MWVLWVPMRSWFITPPPQKKKKNHKKSKKIYVLYKYNLWQYVENRTDGPHNKRKIAENSAALMLNN